MTSSTGILFILLTILSFYLVYKGIKTTLSGAGPSGLTASRIFLIGSSLWALILFVLSYSGILSDFSTFPPYMGIVLLIPLIVVIRLSFSSKFSSLIAKVPVSWLVYIQAFRVVVELLLWMLFVDQLLPIQMTFEGRNWDILVGITAPLVALFQPKRAELKRRILIIWNVAGLLLLLNIVIIALLSMPTPVQYFTNEPANTIVAKFPYVLLPGFLVPLAYAMHIFSLKQLLIIKPAMKASKED